MISKQLVVFLVFFLASLDFTSPKTLREVTFGSTFKLVNLGHQARLHSGEIKYGTGSGQQSVTGLNVNDDVNSHWFVKGSSSTVKRGDPIRCGQKIRLEHGTSGKNLHSHNYPAPLSKHQEVSAFGEHGNGDSGDIWEVVCTSPGAQTWIRDEPVQLKHANTNVWLGLSGQAYGRPISGQFEVVGVPKAGDNACKWTVAEGMFVHPNVSVPGHDDHEHGDEL